MMGVLEELGLYPSEIIGLIEICSVARQWNLETNVGVRVAMSLGDALNLIYRSGVDLSTVEMVKRGEGEGNSLRDYTVVDFVNSSFESAILSGAALKVIGSNQGLTSNPLLRAYLDSRGVQAHYFFSGAFCQAYPGHFDLADAVVIQIVGCKDWQLWPTLPPGDVRRSTRRWCFEDGHELLQIHAGECLTMPAYTPHIVSSNFIPSAHLALAIRGAGSGHLASENN